jgi:hypothetical protein
MSAGNPEGRKTSEISVFWRDLAEQFLTLQDRRLRGVSVGNNFVYDELNALIERGASKIAGADAPDLLDIWREALRKEGFDFHFWNESNEVSDAAEYRQNINRPAIDSVCLTSATLCERLGARAKHAEFEEPFAQSGAKQSPTVTRTPQSCKCSNNERESFVRPRLEEKGWSINDWAANSKVDFHTADEYLKNKRNPFASTLRKLAGALGVPVAQLPK